MHVQQSGFNVTVIVIMQVAVKSVLVKGHLWLIVSRITSNWIYDASCADAGSMNRIASGMTLNSKVFEETGSPSRFT